MESALWWNQTPMTQWAEEHRLGLQAVVTALIVSTCWRPAWRMCVRALEYKVLAEKPRVLCQATDQNQRLLARCPTIMHHTFIPRWNLFNGHLQTAALAFASPETPPSVPYERQILDMPDGGIVSLDWAFPARADGTIPRVSDVDVHRPTLMVLPGLTGDSSELYIRCLVARMLTLGWQAVVMNARGCGNTPLKTPQFFCSGYTDDMRFVLQTLNERYAFRQHGTCVVAAGFSMGANVVVKMLGEDQEQAKNLLCGAMTVGNPFDLLKSSRALTQSPFRRYIYDATLLRNVQRLFFVRTNAAEVFRNHAKLRINAIPKAKTIAEFDDCCTSVLFNYENADAYYRGASSDQFMSKVRVPILCVNAKDDPIAVGDAIPYDAVAQNENVVLCVTKTGGHLAFYGRAEAEGEDEEASKRESQERDGGMWSVAALSEFAESVRKEQQAKL